MPDKHAVLMITGVALHYFLIFFVYYFLYRVIKLLYIDLTQQSQVHLATDQVIRKRKEAYLVVVERGSLTLPQERFLLGDILSIGRNEDNDIVIPDSFVSGEHASISYYKDHYWLADLNSTNKTYLNHKALEAETLLKQGDQIQVGSATFKFEG